MFPTTNLNFKNISTRYSNAMRHCPRVSYIKLDATHFAASQGLCWQIQARLFKRVMWVGAWPECKRYTHTLETLTFIFLRCDFVSGVLLSRFFFPLYRLVAVCIYTCRVAASVARISDVNLHIFFPRQLWFRSCPQSLEKQKRRGIWAMCFC